MDLTKEWAYLEEVAAARLRQNKTQFHMDRYGTHIEILGAAGELAARRFYGLDEHLHTGFDDGCDLIYRGYTIDVKTTRLTRQIQHRYLQWPYFKPVEADIILMAAVQLTQRRAPILGYATREEVDTAPINYSRDVPCREIPVTRLHPAWHLENLKPGRPA